MAGGLDQTLCVLTDLDDEIQGLVAEQRALAQALLPLGYMRQPEVKQNAAQQKTRRDAPRKTARHGSRFNKRRKPGRALINALFCVVLAAMLITALSYRMGGNGRRNLGGYSLFNVVTASMQSVIPQGSLVITRYTNPREIMVNDDITFLLSDKTSVTHRVVDIIEDYKETEQRGFLTKGVDNDVPDRDPVYAQNVAGRVVWHAPGLGAALVGISDHWLAVVAPLAGLCLVFALLKVFLYLRLPAPARDARHMRGAVAPAPADTMVIYR